MKKVLVGLLFVPFALLARPKNPESCALPTTVTPEVEVAVKKAVAQPHPRLFATQADFDALKDRCATDAYVKMGFEQVKFVSGQLLSLPPVERIKVGRRLLSVSRLALWRITSLALAYRLGGDARYLERAVAELKAVCAFSDWNPSHFLDVGEMSLAVATGFDWLYQDLDAATRTEIAAGLRRHGLEAATRVTGWARASNNWGQVCHAGILAAALALAEENPAETARYVQRCVAMLPISVKALAPNGNYPEGPGYWGYGVNFNVLAVDLCERTLGNDFGLASLPGFRETANYRDLVTGPSGRTFNYADGSDGRSTCCATWWFAQHEKRSDILVYREAADYAEYANSRKKMSPKGGNRLFAYSVLWVREPQKDAPFQLPLVWDAGGKVPIAIQRSSWNDDEALFVGIKGGSPSAPHAHMDGGSFVLDAKRIRWAVDLGAENYTKIEALGMNLWGHSQDCDRWKIFRLGTSSHNVPMIDGCQQKVAGFAKFLKVEKGEQGAASEVVVDLTSLYTNATSVIRTGKMSASGKGYRLRDVIAGMRPGASVRWCMTTRAQAVVDGETVTLTQDGQTIKLMQYGAQKGVWCVAPAKGPHDYDSPNTGASQLTFTVTATEAGTADLSVVFFSGDDSTSVNLTREGAL